MPSAPDASTVITTSWWLLFAAFYNTGNYNYYRTLDKVTHLRNKILPSQAFDNNLAEILTRALRVCHTHFLGSFLHQDPFLLQSAVQGLYTYGTLDDSNLFDRLTISCKKKQVNDLILKQ